jgi:Mrp family chromosome partitioning ATPase
MLEQARIDEALGPGRVSNIQVIQEPSPPYKDYQKFYKVLASLAVGGLALGLAWAFLIEFYFDRSVKRPVDLQTKLRIPFFLSIPDLNHNGFGNRLGAPARKQLAYNGDHAANGNSALELASPTVNHALHSHYDALRDRLVNYFESINLTRKPKLVAVTSAAKGAGVSTIAAGLAASLSETGDGRVLLVDMNLENGAAQQFVRGKPGCQLDDALVSEKRDNALVQENLYVVSEGSNADKLPRILPKRFASLVPKLKASDYDYIIFDMPPVTQTSVTTRLAGFMDTVMLVVESEKTDRDVVQQANQLLLQSKANVTAVLNKTRKYIPARLQHDINADM